MDKTLHCSCVCLVNVSPVIDMAKLSQRKVYIIVCKTMRCIYFSTDVYVFPTLCVCKKPQEVEY